MQQNNVDAGFNVRVLEALKNKVSTMPPRSKLCAIVMDEMSIKEPLAYNSEKDEIEGFENFDLIGKTKYVANHAIVFMAKGMILKWKQPIGYFLSSGSMTGSTMKGILLDCIHKLTAAGLLVKLVICDQGSNNQNLFSLLKTSADKPYLEVLGSKVYVLYDPPHLIKSIRNKFKKHGFVRDGELVEWEHVKEFYHIDSKQGIRLIQILLLSARYPCSLLGCSTVACVTCNVKRNHCPVFIFKVFGFTCDRMKEELNFIFTVYTGRRSRPTLQRPQGA